ncbi:MAG TPA: antibiotic biosynthesis monooxygenase [Nitrolancea sp.]|jgi:heme-degrading monooxygenase HmoA|nr:antibiotic biosynthesis monooxygenase [Nitrolancea sp.]
MPRHLILGLVTLKPGNRPAAEQIADRGAPGIAQQPGYEGVTFFIDEERNVYGAVSFWESREAAEQANDVLTPQFEQAFGDLLVGSIDTRIYEVYEHKQ